MNPARLFKQAQKSKKTYFKDLKDGQLAVITDSSFKEHIGKIVVKVHKRDIVQTLGYSDAWIYLYNNPIQVRILEPGELIEVQ